MYIKLVDFPLNIDLAKEKDFCASKWAFLFQFALREFLFDFEVRFLGTAMIKNYFNITELNSIILIINCQVILYRFNFKIKLVTEKNHKYFSK